jgi:hypothetical protein
MTRFIMIIFTLAAWTAAGCGDEPAAPDKADDVLETWKSAGLEVGEHALLPKHELGDARCVRGEVGQIETTLCSYRSDEAATAAKVAGHELVGSTTGTALARGKLLLVVSDRTDAHKDGKTIHTLTKTFLGR